MYDKANEYFKKFISKNFDLNDEKISHKVKHTYRVVDNAKYLCDSMNIDSENTELALVIALLHDIGRFDQAKEMKSFREDINNYDHATLGVKLLFDENQIRNYIDNDKYDIIIKTAISNHSKFILDCSNMSELEVLHSKIVRDADKLDTLYSKTVDDIYTMAIITEEDIENSKITDKTYNDFMSEKTIFSKDRKTGIDIWLSYIAFIFGLEFSSSINLVKEKGYIDKLFNRFNYNLEKERMNILYNKANEYINNKSN